MIREGIMSFPPEAFIIGAQKCGTSYLSYLLDQHPRITLSNPKEPDYYTRNHKKGLDWYKNLFHGHSENVFLDASTSYSAARLSEYDGDNLDGNPYLHNVPFRIHSDSPNAKIIYIVRNPVARTYSSYWQNIKTGAKEIPFREAINRNSFYLRLGDYAGQLKLYQEHFPKENILVLLLEEFKAAPIYIVQKCFNFLELDDKYDLELSNGKNTSFQYSKWTKKINSVLSKIGGLYGIIRFAKPIVPRQAHRFAARLITSKIPPIDKDDELFLKNHFKEKNKELKESFGVPIEKWGL